MEYVKKTVAILILLAIFATLIAKAGKGEVRLRIDREHRVWSMRSGLWEYVELSS